jgi:S1-C subfamily serine protease
MPARPRTLLGSLVLLPILLTWSAGTAGELRPEPVKEAPRLVIKPVPESIEDLRDLERRVQEVVAKVSAATVCLRIGAGQGSGVIVKDGLILTAGHVSGVPDGPTSIVFPDGKTIKGKALGRNTGIDSGMVKITEEGKWPTVEIGKSSDLKKGQWVIAIGHPGGHRPNRPLVVRVGRIIEVTSFVIRTDCTLVGGDSGGPLFDLEGRVVGIHSRIGGFRIDENFHVPVDTFLSTWERLVRGESWGGQLGTVAVVRSPGGKVVFEKADKITASDPEDVRREPRDKAGRFKTFDFRMNPASVYTIDMTGGDRKKPFDPYLRLEDSTGKKITDDDDGGGDMNSRIVFRPTREDTYRIVASTFDPNQYGDFKLSIRQLEPKDLYVTGKADALQVFAMPRELVPLAWTKMSKQGALGVRGTLLDSAGKIVADREVPFNWSGGSSGKKTDSLGIIRQPLSKEMLKDLAVDVPAGHRLLLELTDAEFAPLYRTFEASVASAGGPVVLAVGDRLTERDPVDKLRTGCRHQVHTLTTVAGGTYTFDLESPQFDAFLRLEDATGKALASDDDSGQHLNARIVHKATANDTLRIIVSSSGPGQTGSYDLTVRRKE